MEFHGESESSVMKFSRGGKWIILNQNVRLVEVGRVENKEQVWVGARTLINSQ